MPRRRPLLPTSSSPTRGCGSPGGAFADRRRRHRRPHHGASGDAADVVALAGPRTRVVERPVGCVLPGFQDSHVHAPFAGRNRLRVWLNDLLGSEAYLDAIAAYAAAQPRRAVDRSAAAGRWSSSPAARRARRTSTRSCPDRPVFLFNKDVHGAWVNSRALEVGGITPRHARPVRRPDRARRRRRADRACLHEGAAYSFNDRVVPGPEHEPSGRPSILEAQRHLHALGITGWQDAWVTPATLEAYRSPRAPTAGSPAASSARCGGTGTAASSRSPTCWPSASSAPARASAGSGVPASSRRR